MQGIAPVPKSSDRARLGHAVTVCCARPASQSHKSMSLSSHDAISAKSWKKHGKRHVQAAQEDIRQCEERRTSNWSNRERAEHSRLSHGSHDTNILSKSRACLQRIRVQKRDEARIVASSQPLRCALPRRVSTPLYWTISTAYPWKGVSSLRRRLQQCQFGLGGTGPLARWVSQAVSVNQVSLSSTSARP